MHRRAGRQARRDPIAEARVIPIQLYLGPSEAPVEIRVFGPGFADMDRLRGYAERVKTMVRDQPGTWDVSDSWGVPGFQLKVDVDEDRANLAGEPGAGAALLVRGRHGLPIDAARGPP